MSPEAQRVAIATACGWHVHFEGKVPYISHSKDADFERRAGMLPSYLDDLDEMHSAERKVMLPNIKLRNEYAAELRCVDMPLTEFFFLHATAAQRAAAFLKTLSLWEP